MGGFVIDEPGKKPYTLSPKHLESLLERGEITLPSIRAKEIEDKSKGDFLAKGIVVLQTLWFVTQCIARGVQGLAITELELVTLVLLCSTESLTTFGGINHWTFAVQCISSWSAKSQ